MEKKNLLQLKKKLFILAGYLMVTALLFVYVSYSQYKITVEATVRMPKVYTMQAGIDLSSVDANDVETDRGLKYGVDFVADDHTTTERAIEAKGFLDELVPGNKAETYASSGSGDTQHKLVVKVNNQLVEEGVTTASPLGVQYTLSVETDGVLPLQFILYDNGATYSALTVHGGPQSVQFIDPSTGAAKVFTIDAGGESEDKPWRENTHEIYVGWNNSDSKGTDISLCKEVEKIVVKAKITALPAPKAIFENPPEVNLIMREEN